MEQASERARLTPAGVRRPITVYTPARGAPATPGRELRGHPGRTTATVHEGASIAVGIVPLVAGLALLGVARGTLGRVRITPGTPPWVVAAIGLSFVVCGLAFLGHGWRGLSRRRRVRRLRVNHPREPWLWEHPWNAFAAFDETRAELRGALAVTSFLALFLLPFNWLAFASGAGDWLFVGVTTLFDALLLLSAGKLVHVAMRLGKYGTTELRFPRFPCRPGEAAEFRLVRTPELATLGALRATLRCIQERHETTGAGRARHVRVVAWALHESPATGETTPGGEAVVFRFHLPPDAPGSALGERPPRYWELAVGAAAPGVDYEATFLVPIYGRPG